MLPTPWWFGCGRIALGTKPLASLEPVALDLFAPLKTLRFYTDEAHLLSWSVEPLRSLTLRLLANPPPLVIHQNPNPPSASEVSPETVNPLEISM